MSGLTRFARSMLPRNMVGSALAFRVPIADSITHYTMRQ